jgi:hypothetical protein
LNKKDGAANDQTRSPRKSRHRRSPSKSRSRSPRQNKSNRQRSPPKDKRKHHQQPQQKPVVKLHPSNDRSDDEEASNSSDAISKNSKNEIKIDEFLPIKQNNVDQNNVEMKMLKALTAKAKESLEKKKNTVVENKLTPVAIPQTIKIFTANMVEVEATSTVIEQGPSMGTSASSSSRNHSDKQKIIIKPFKINDHSPKRAGNTIDMMNEEAKKGHSRSTVKKTSEENSTKEPKPPANTHSSSFER